MQDQTAEQELTWSGQRAIDNAYDQNKKSILIAYILALVTPALFGIGLAFRLFLMFLGFFGVHRFYLHKNWTGALMGTLSFGGFCLLTVVKILFGESLLGELGSYLAFLMMLAATVWLIVDLCLIPGMVRRFNRTLTEKLKQDQSASSLG